MGCFSITCMISDLPINHRDDVVMFLTCPNRHAYEWKALNADRYFSSNTLLDPVTLQFYGKYNDYGDIEDIEDNFNSNHFINHFKWMLKNGKVYKTKHRFYTTKERNDTKLMMSIPSHTAYKYEKYVVKPKRNKKYEIVEDCLIDGNDLYSFERWSKTKLQDRIISLDSHLKLDRLMGKSNKRIKEWEKTLKKLKTMKDEDNTFVPVKVFVHRRIFEKMVEIMAKDTYYRRYTFKKLYEIDLKYYIESIRLNYKRWEKEPSEDNSYWLGHGNWEELRHYGFPEISAYRCIDEEDYDTTLKSLEWDTRIKKGEWKKKGDYTGDNAMNYAFKDNIEMWHYFQYILDNHDKDLTEFSDELIKFMLFQQGLRALNRGWRASFSGSQDGEHKIHSALLKEFSAISDKKSRRRYR